MNLIETSLQIALQAYAGKTDKAGKTYILHPLRIMAKMETEQEMAVALLHDVIEDSSFTAMDLKKAKIPNTVIEAVQCLTKQDNEDYQDFIQRTMSNTLAAKVKKADIEDNINVLRLDSLSDNDLERVTKYHKAWLLLNNQ